MLISIPTDGIYPAYYPNYFKLLDGSIDVLQQLHDDAEKFRLLIEKIPAEKVTYAYAENKWTSFQLIQHIIDTERIFCYRALSIARGEEISLPGFDENKYAFKAQVHHKNPSVMALEWLTVRQATFSLLFGLTSQEIKSTGTANGNNVSVEAIACMIVAHARHHFNVLTERYL